jgi:hypothetical protein
MHSTCGCSGLRELTAVQMANAGFHYAPTKEEPDYCLCPFCGVSLANFEPEDDPRFGSSSRRLAILLMIFVGWNITGVPPIATSSKQNPRKGNVGPGHRLCLEVGVLPEQLQWRRDLLLNAAGREIQTTWRMTRNLRRRNHVVNEQVR